MGSHNYPGLCHSRFQTLLSDVGFIHCHLRDSFICLNLLIKCDRLHCLTAKRILMEQSVSFVALNSMDFVLNHFVEIFDVLKIQGFKDVYKIFTLNMSHLVCIKYIKQICCTLRDSFNENVPCFAKVDNTDNSQITLGWTNAKCICF